LTGFYQSLPILLRDELIKVLVLCGFNEIRTLKTSRSRRKFGDDKANVILLHIPHPSIIVKKYALRQVIDYLKQQGAITDE